MTTEELARTAAQSGVLPAADTLVLLNRKLRPGTVEAEMSVFADDRWDLRPAIFEDHLNAVSLNFLAVPAQFRDAAKAYIWLELNCDEAPPVLRRASVTGRLAVYTMVAQLRNLRGLLDWLDTQGFDAISSVTSKDLDDYLQAVIDSERTHGHRSDLLQAVRRLWSFREFMPEDGRLPARPPWGGRDTRVLLGEPQRDRENRTPRIQEATMSMTLLWALRFVQDFADDILEAMEEFRPLRGLQPGRYSPGLDHRRVRIPGQAGSTPEVTALIENFRRTGLKLPGRRDKAGQWEPDWPFLSKLLDIAPDALKKNQKYRRAFLDSGIALADGAHLAARPKALLDGEPWMAGFRYDEVKRLAGMLSTACFILICYLTGMRPGEVLNLRRGCSGRDAVTGLWLINGLKWKGATAEDGTKIPEGQVRDEPWGAVEVVALAVGVLERLHDGELLFPAWTVQDGRTSREDEARTFGPINADLNRFVAWVNSYCGQNGREDVIPVDPQNLTTRRFRRTLAWFICRRPRRLVAAAIQYGHLRVQITQGYSGTYASGFPDDLAFERWLARLDELDEADRKLKAGEHASGPAADAFRSRVAGGVQKFAGRVIRTGREARQILGNPALQIYPGKAMTCVFSAATALCELEPGLDDTRYTPDTDDCRPGCRNIARTEENIAAVRSEADQLRRIVADEASPPLRLERERRRLAYLERIVAEHENGQQDLGEDA
ncbi:hypothetical protein [Kitasatospora sp. NPDC088134]|uniref:hypothetical protein n=1 Tax=Kitasatospora sp. NPDC088134 TaxID=3364071 RepID=UPI0037F2B24C